MRKYSPQPTALQTDQTIRCTNDHARGGATVRLWGFTLNEVAAEQQYLPSGKPVNKIGWIRSDPDAARMGRVAMVRRCGWEKWDLVKL